MNYTSFQARQLNAIRKEHREARAKFEATKATAEIGIVSNFQGTYTVNTLNGHWKPNFEDRPFPSATEALKAYARQFGTGTLKKTATGTFLVYTK